MTKPDYREHSSPQHSSFASLHSAVIRHSGFFFSMISVSSLTKRFTGARLALDDVSFEVKQAAIMGLLGHNGAGKSTVLGIMLGMVRPDAGEVHVAGHSVQRDRATALRQIGAIFEA